MSIRFAVALLALVSCHAWAEDLAVPKADLPGLSDPAGIKRIEGSILIGRDQVAYDEITLPSGALRRGDDGEDRASSSLPTSAGARTRLIYLLPRGRSTLEAIRSYQTEMSAAGFKANWECADDACGASNISGYNMLNQIWPSSAWTFADTSPASCAAGGMVAEQRYAALHNATTGAVLGVVAWRPQINSIYCAEGEFQQQVAVAIVLITPKERVQSMVSVSASEMEKSIAQTGRVALYGIHFDTASASLKAESKAALDEIAKLLNSQPNLKLHIVGHTDDQGGLDANFDLSRRRAAAVREALTTQYAIAATRLTANGVSYLAPVASNSDEAGRAKNRRVELVPM